MEGYVEHYNNVRPNSAISITPKGHTHRASTLDPRRQGSEAGGGQATTADSSPVAA
jgi:hypothetical protein